MAQRDRLTFWSCKVHACASLSFVAGKIRLVFITDVVGLPDRVLRPHSWGAGIRQAVKLVDAAEREKPAAGGVTGQAPRVGR